MEMNRDNFVKMCERYAKAEREFSRAKQDIMEALGVFGQPCVLKIDWVKISRIGLHMLRQDYEQYAVNDAVDRRVRK